MKFALPLFRRLPKRNRLANRNRLPKRHRVRRRGSVTAEMAVVTPIILLSFFSLWEWSRVEMIRNVCENAVFEGARHGTLPGSSDTSTDAKVQEILDVYSVRSATISSSVQPRQATVTLSVPIDANAFFGMGIFQGRKIDAQMTLER